MMHILTDFSTDGNNTILNGRLRLYVYITYFTDVMGYNADDNILCGSQHKLIG